MKTTKKKESLQTKKNQIKSMSMRVICFAFLIQNGINAQNTSYDQNTIPVSGFNNSAFGFNALNNTGTGVANTAIGWGSMFSNSTGDRNTACGQESLYNNTIGYKNTALGHESLFSNLGGIYNTATGWASLYSNKDGDNNTATGIIALYNNQNGSHNTATGMGALRFNIDGYYNTATGCHALDSNTTGYHNVADGMYSLWTNTTGRENGGFGYNTDVSAKNLYNATALGNGAVVNSNDKIRFGNAAVTVVEGPVAYTFSEGRFKSDISENDVKGLEFINKLRPVVYNLETKKITEFWTKNMSAEAKKRHLDNNFEPSTAIRQSGFIAQEVEKAAKEAGYNFNGVHTPTNENDNYSISYSQFVVPLVKGMQEQQAMIEQLTKQIEELKRNQGSSNDSKATGINQLSNSNNSFKMEQNEPNPFNNETVVKYTIPQEVNNAYMAVYDLSGKQLTTLPISQKGSSSLIITSEKLAAGIYIYSIIADGKMIDSKKMIVAEK